MSSPLRRWWHFGVAGGIPLLALALGAGNSEARSVERDIGSGAGQKTSAQKATTPENRKAVPAESRSAGARNHDPCCAEDPPVPRARVGGTTTESRVAPATAPPQSSVRGTAPGASPATPEVRPTGIRSVKRDGRAVPPWKQGEQRRGGVGGLIGITFA